MFEVGLSKGFRAWHVMPDVEGPESELHAHDYRLDVVVTRKELDERGMVCDLDLVQAALDKVVATVEDKNLELIRPETSPAVTVEVLARWAHDEIADLLENRDIGLSVRAWESPVAFGGYASRPRSS
jgi:6-pyruvoyltetrahydropterin/6-carboxytetrahydropterin synthase